MYEIGILLLSKSIPVDVCFKIYYKLATIKVDHTLKNDIIVYNNIHIIIDSCDDDYTLNLLRFYISEKFILEEYTKFTANIKSDIKSLWNMLYPEEKTLLLRDWNNINDTSSLNDYYYHADIKSTKRYDCITLYSDCFPFIPYS